MTDRVLITGARAAVALDIARDFRAAGWEPHLADCSPARVAQWSRAPAAVHRYPSPVYDPAGFRAAVAALVDRLDARLIVPTCEEVFHLAAPSLAASLGARLFAPPLATLRTLHDKLAFAGACVASGLPAPESHAIDSDGDLARFAGDSRNWVFKPRFSRFGEAARIGPAPAEVERLGITPERPWLAQRRIRGHEASFYAIARDGALAAFAAYRSDWRMRGGASFAFQPLEAGEAQVLRDYAAQLADATMLTGQFACDAMFDADGQAWLIECNPRATSGAHALAGTGCLARAMLGQRIAAASPKPGYIGPAMMLFGLPQAIAGARMSAWRRTVAAGRDVLGRPGDRWPVLGAVVDVAAFALAAQLNGVTVTAATTRDIEWNGGVLT